MIAVPDWPYGPYTIDDLDALPDEGVRRELVNGWITVAPWPGPRHDHAAKVLERALDRAAEEARAARERRARAYDAIDALVVVEIISPRGGTERADRVDKIFEYARAGIPQYWLIDLEPEPHVTVRTLGDDCRFHVTASVPAGTALKLDEPFRFSLDPEELVGQVPMGDRRAPGRSGGLGLGVG